MARKKPAAVEALDALQSKPPQCQADPNCEEAAVGANRVCLHHQTADIDKAARAKCKELGLHTVDQMRAYFRKKRPWHPFEDATPNEDQSREIARKVATGEIPVGGTK